MLTSSRSSRAPPTRVYSQASRSVRPTDGAGVPIVVWTATDSSGRPKSAPRSLPPSTRVQSSGRRPWSIGTPFAVAVSAVAGNVGTGSAPGSPAALPHPARPAQVSTTAATPATALISTDAPPAAAALASPAVPPEAPPPGPRPSGADHRGTHPNPPQK